MLDRDRDNKNLIREFNIRLEEIIRKKTLIKIKIKESLIRMIISRFNFTHPNQVIVYLYNYRQLAS